MAMTPVLPVHLFPPAFVHFTDIVTNDTPVDHEVVRATVCHMQVVTGIYDREAL